jgi:hypothetical protein
VSPVLDGNQTDVGTNIAVEEVASQLLNRQQKGTYAFHRIWFIFPVWGLTIIFT